MKRGCGGLVLLLMVCVNSGSAEVAQAQAESTPPSPQPGSPDWASIERQLSEEVRRAPDSFDAHHRLAAFYLQQGQLEAAIPHLQRAQALDPTHYINSYDLAAALLETGRLDDARAQVRRMLAVKDTGELHNLIGDIEERAGNIALAAEEYKRAADMDPTEEHFFDWGNNLVRQRQFAPATDVFSAGIARHTPSRRGFMSAWGSLTTRTANIERP